MKSNSVFTVCIHCSSGCPLEYKVKEGSIHTSSFCSVGNLGFNYASTTLKNETAFKNAVLALKNTEAIRFSSMITNEEVHILQLLKKKLNIKLFNEDARVYGAFMKAYSSVSGKLHHSASIDTIKQADGVIIIGSRISTDNPAIRDALGLAYRNNDAKIVYTHPIEDKLLEDSITQFIKYEAGSEEGVMALLANELFRDIALSDTDREYFNDLDLGYLEAESNVGSDELEFLGESFKDAKKCVLIVGSDLFAHTRASNIAKFAAMIEKYTNFLLLVIPSEVNTVGVSLIADLDKDEELKHVVAYNEKGSFVISSLEKSDLKLPALNQQEGTIVNIDNEVIKLNIVLEFNGYTLNDLANSLGLLQKSAINYTKELSSLAGFKAVEFGSIKNSSITNSEHREAYILDEVSCDVNAVLEEVLELPEYNGTVIYQSNPIVQFNAYTNVSKELEKDASLRGSAQFSRVANVSDGDFIEIDTGFKVVRRVFKLDEDLKGTIALHPSFDINIDKGLYKFLKSNIMRVDK